MKQKIAFVNRTSLTGRFKTSHNKLVRQRQTNTNMIGSDHYLRRRLDYESNPKMKLRFTRTAEAYSSHPDWANFKRCISCGQVNEIGKNSVGTGNGLSTTQLTETSKTVEVVGGCGLCGSKNWLGTN